jgi:hypothetical protein
MVAIVANNHPVLHNIARSYITGINVIEGPTSEHITALIKSTTAKYGMKNCPSFSGKISGIRSLIYDIVLAIVVSASCGILVVLYFLIGRTINKCMKQSGHSITNSKIYSENSENDFMDKSGSTVDTDLKTIIFI